MESILLQASERAEKKSNKQLRREGLIPAVLYGRGAASLTLNIPAKEFIRSRAAGGANAIYNLAVAGKAEKYLAMVKDIQRQGLGSEILHVDFHRISLAEKIHARIPLVTHGEALGVKAGGTLQHHLREIEVECLPTEIPEHYSIDITNLDLGHSLFVRDLPQSELVRIIADADTVVLSVLAPVEEAEAETPAEGPAEPEMVTKAEKE